ncbi:MAG: MgtC/SapB family protein [Chloroflexota bacterium]
MLHISEAEAVLRMGLALAFGAMIGAERERGGHFAGMRTHALVCLGSTVFMLVSAYSFPDVIKITGVRIDPTRIAAQVVSGIGFLGAGMIFRQQGISVPGGTNIGSRADVRNSNCDLQCEKER